MLYQNSLPIYPAQPMAVPLLQQTETLPSYLIHFGAQPSGLIIFSTLARTGEKQMTGLLQRIRGECDFPYLNRYINIRNKQLLFKHFQ